MPVTSPLSPKLGQQCARRDPARHPGLPGATRTLAIQRSFTAKEYEQLKLGLVPQQMEDHWFLCFDNQEKQLHCYRSWTNFCIFVAQFEEGTDGSARLLQALANADPDQFRCADPQQATRLLEGLLDRLLRSD